MRLQFALGLCVALVASTARAEATVEIVRLEPTVLFPHDEPLRQVARLTLASKGKHAEKFTLRVLMTGKKPLEQSLGVVSAGETTRDVLVPDIQKPTELRIELLTSDGDCVSEYETTWQPQRHWVIYIVKSAHTDLGYENAEFIKREDLARYVDDARKITDATWELPEPSRYRWTIEHLYWLRKCLDVRPWSWYRELIDDYVKTGKTALMAPYCGVHTHWHGLEQLCRSTYWSRRHLHDQFDLEQPLFYIADNPTVAWPVAQVWALAGGRYVVDCRQGWRTGGKDGYAHHDVPHVFWWAGPDGRSKVLFYWARQYGMGRPIVDGDYDKTLASVTRQLAALEGGRCGPYPYDLFLAPAYMDHQPPGKNESDRVVEWNRRWRYPELRIDDPTKFMTELERRFGDCIPTLAGDMNNYSADYAAADPDTFGRKRDAGHRLAAAEGFSSVARLIEPRYPLAQQATDDAYRYLCEYDDHTWPTGPAPCDYNETNFGLIKRHGARLAAQIAEGQLDRALGLIASKIACPEAPAIVVFNPLGHERTDVVRVPLAELPEEKGDRSNLCEASSGPLPANWTCPLFPIDATSGKPTLCQIIGDQLLLLARDIPAFGYKTYRLTKGPKPEGTGALKASETTLENDFYCVAFDNETGTIVSIRDKELDRELIDTSGPHRFNQFICDYRISKLSTVGFNSSPTEATLRVECDGPLAATILVETHEPKSGAEIRQRVTLYRGLKRVEIEDELRKVRAIWGDDRTFNRQWGQVGPRYKDNVFLAFPLNVPDATVRGEYSLGTVRPYDDQLRLGTHDFLSVQQYVDCSNEEYGVTWTTREAPCVHIGEIRYNQFSNTYKPERPWLYSYVMSNRLAGLYWHHPDRPQATLHYTLTSHAGSWPSGGAAGYGWERARPLCASVLSGKQGGPLPAEQSFVSLDAPNIQLVVLKPSEQAGRGFVLRLVETEGRPQTRVHVRLPLWSLARAMQCDVVENDGEPISLDADARGFHVSVGCYGLVTVRLVPQDDTPPRVNDLRADAVSDKAIRLRWQPATGATSYQVYRLPAAGERPVLDHLVAETCDTEYLDDWLDLDMPYSYRVVAIGPGNLAAQPSEEVTARTKVDDASPPAPVRDLAAIERSCRRIILTWQSSRESDVAGYEIYRGTQPDFPLDAEHRIHAKDEPDPYARQWFFDTDVEPGTTYFYRVLAVDRGKRRSPSSPVARLDLCEDPGPPRPEPEEEGFPSTVEGRMPSKALGREVRYSLWLPAGKAPTNGWPVLLILHSNGRHCDSLLQMAGTVDQLVNAPFAVAFADGGTSCWIDSPVEPESRYHSMVVELLDHLSDKHPISRRAEFRAATGWSVGGYGAMLLAARHPNLVGSASSMIGLLDLPRTTPAGACSLHLFGPKDPAWDDLSVCRQAASLRGKALAIFTSAEGIDVPHTEVVRDSLEKADIQCRFETVPGRHDIATALTMWPKVVAFHYEVFRAAGVVPESE